MKDVRRFRLRLYRLVERGLQQEVADHIWLHGAEDLLSDLEAATDAGLQSIPTTTKARWATSFAVDPPVD